jgi:hypothetical protein
MEKWKVHGALRTMNERIKDCREGCLAKKKKREAQETKKRYDNWHVEVGRIYTNSKAVIPFMRTWLEISPRQVVLLVQASSYLPVNWRIMAGLDVPPTVRTRQKLHGYGPITSSKCFMLGLSEGAYAPLLNQEKQSEHKPKRM